MGLPGLRRGNIGAGMPDASGGEVIETLAMMAGRHVRVERIVSGGHAGPEGFWYDQAWDEWVIVLRGKAALGIRNSDETKKPGSSGTEICEKTEILEEGDWALIPAHREHRVESTAKETLWLAVHAGG